MKYTIHVHNNETGKETTYEGDKIICTAIRNDAETDDMVANGEMDIPARDFVSWLTSCDFYDDMLGWLMMHTLNKMLPGEKVEPLPGDGTCPLRHEGSDAMN